MAAPTPQQMQDLRDAISRLEQLTGSPQNLFNFNTISGDVNLFNNALNLVNDQIRQISGDVNYLD